LAAGNARTRDSAPTKVRAGAGLIKEI